MRRHLSIKTSNSVETRTQDLCQNEVTGSQGVFIYLSHHGELGWGGTTYFETNPLCRRQFLCFAANLVPVRWLSWDEFVPHRWRRRLTRLTPLAICKS